MTAELYLMASEKEKRYRTTALGSSGSRAWSGANRVLAPRSATERRHPLALHEIAGLGRQQRCHSSGKPRTRRTQTRRSTAESAVSSWTLSVTPSQLGEDCRDGCPHDTRPQRFEQRVHHGENGRVHVHDPKQNEVRRAPQKQSH